MQASGRAGKLSNMHIVGALFLAGLGISGIFAKTCTLKPLGSGKSDVSQVRPLHLRIHFPTRLYATDTSLYAPDDWVYAANDPIHVPRSKQPSRNVGTGARLSSSPGSTTLLGRMKTEST